jgi:membrane protease YdiL (CAAX protease family)
MEVNMFPIPRTSKNSDPIVWFIILFFIFLIVGTLATFLSLHQEETAGQLQNPYYFMKRYQVLEPYTLSLTPYTSVTFQSDSSLLPAQNQANQFQGLVSIGSGFISVNIPGKTPVERPFTQIYLPLASDQWQALKPYLAVSKTGPSSEEIKTAAELTDKRAYLAFSYDLFGYNRLYPNSFTHSALFYEDSQLYRLKQSDYIDIESWGNGVIFRAYTGDQQNPSDKTQDNISSNIKLGYVLSFVSSILALSFIFVYTTTAHYIHYPTYNIHLPKINGWYTIIVVTFFLVLNPIWKGNYNIHAYVTIGCMYLYLFPFIHSPMLWRDFGFRLKGLSTALLSAVLLAIGIQIVASLQIPSSFRITEFNFEPWITTFLTVSLLHECYFRGIIQNYLRKAFGSRIAIAFTVLIMVLYSLAMAFSEIGFMDFSEEIIQFVLIQPALFFIAAYFYERVRNIWASALLHTLILMLPQSLSVGF